MKYRINFNHPMKYLAWAVKSSKYNDNTGNNSYFSYVNKDVNGFNNTFAS